MRSVSLMMPLMYSECDASRWLNVSSSFKNFLTSSRALATISGCLTKWENMYTSVAEVVSLVGSAVAQDLGNIKVRCLPAGYNDESRVPLKIRPF